MHLGSFSRLSKTTPNPVHVFIAVKMANDFVITSVLLFYYFFVCIVDIMGRIAYSNIFTCPIFLVLSYCLVHKTTLVAEDCENWESDKKTLSSTKKLVFFFVLCVCKRLEFVDDFKWRRFNSELAGRCDDHIRNLEFEIMMIIWSCLDALL